MNSAGNIGKVAVLICLGCAVTSSTLGQCVWKVTGPRGGTAYLGGSFHALRSSDYPLPSAYNRAFEASERLVFEIGPGSFANRFDRSGRYGHGDSLRNHVDPRTYAYLQRIFGHLGVPEATYSDYKPWYLSSKISLPGEGNLVQSLGVEYYLSHRASMNHKPFSGLETYQEHLEVFSGLTDRQGEAVLLITLIHCDEGSRFAQDIAAWRRGDAEALAAAAKRDYAEFPVFGERILDDRNRRWIPKIEEYLGSGHIYFVVVGAAHMGGPNGVLALLRARGYRIAQL
ncbi:MAG: TraB/GumN family protein [Chthoniobacterales bacterium]